MDRTMTVIEWVGATLLVALVVPLLVLQVIRWVDTVNEVTRMIEERGQHTQQIDPAVLEPKLDMPPAP